MKEIEFYLTSEINCFKDFALNIGNAFNVNMEREGNVVTFPKQIGSGSMSFYEFEQGFGILRIAASFSETCRFYRYPIKSNDYLLIHFNLSDSRVLLKDSVHKTTDIGTDWHSAVFYSTTGQYSEVHPTPNKDLLSVVMIIHRSWILKNLSLYISSAKEIQDFIGNKSFQGFMDLDLDEMIIAEELLAKPIEGEWDILYHKGLVFKLAACFFQNLETKRKTSNKDDFAAISRLMHIKRLLEDNLEKPWPTIDTIAEECSVSKSKFIRLFKKIYHKNYYQYYRELRMRKAALLLEQGLGVSHVAHKVGFTNISHFSADFKEHFKIEPRYYKKGLTQ